MKNSFALAVLTPLASVGIALTSVAVVSSSCTSSNAVSTTVDAAAPQDGAIVDATLPDGAVVLSQIVVPRLLFANTSDAGAENVDTDLVNPWGLAFNPKGVAWINAEGKGLSTVFPPGATAHTLAVTIPPPPSADAGTASRPTGIVLNPTATNFMGDTFIFATLDGTISGWQSTFDVATSAVIRVDNSGGFPATNQVYTGLALALSSPPVLLAANFSRGTIDVFDTSYASQTPATGAWTDPSVPAGYAPFNVVAIGPTVYVLYAKQNATKTVGVPGSGAGAVSAFDLTGTLVKTLLSVADGGPLDAPWGLTSAPSGWGAVGGDLLIGNFGNGAINAFSPTTGAWLGMITKNSGQPVSYDGLWSIEFPVAYAADGGATDMIDSGGGALPLYFTAGPALGTEGLYGTLSLP